MAIPASSAVSSLPLKPQIFLFSEARQSTTILPLERGRERTPNNTSPRLKKNKLPVNPFKTSFEALICIVPYVSLCKYFSRARMFVPLGEKEEKKKFNKSFCNND